MRSGGASVTVRTQIRHQKHEDALCRANGYTLLKGYGGRRMPMETRQMEKDFILQPSQIIKHKQPILDFLYQDHHR